MHYYFPIKLIKKIHEMLISSHCPNKLLTGRFEILGEKLWKHVQHVIIDNKQFELCV